MKLFSRVLFALPLLCLVSGTAHAQLSFNGILFENFNGLITSGTNQTWTNNSTLSGWSIFNKDVTAITQYNAGDGSSNTGKFYSFGTGTNSDRSLGGVASSNTYFGTPGPASGAVAGWIAVNIQNTSGKTLDQFTIQYTGEQWRNGGNTTAQTMQLQYGYGATFGTVSTWFTPGSAFNFTSLQNTATASALDGNLAANRTTNLGGTVTGQTWANNQQLWVRWIENNDAGNDHGLGIDDFVFSSSAILPEPGTFALAGLGLMGGLILRRRRK